MHAAHIKTAETISIAAPASARASGTPRPLPADGSFGLQWQREMTARTTSANGQTKKTAEQAIPEPVAKDEQVSPASTASRPGVSAEEIIEPKVEAGSQSDAAPRANAIRAARVSDAPNAEAAASSSAKSDRTNESASTSPKAKRTVATAETGDVPRDVKSMPEAGPGGTAVVTAGIQPNFQTGAIAVVVNIAMAESGDRPRVATSVAEAGPAVTAVVVPNVQAGVQTGAATSLADAAASGTSASARATLPGLKRPAAIAETAKGAVAKLAQTPEGKIATSAGREVKVTSPSQTGSHSGGEQAAAGAIASGGHANAEAAQPIQPGLQLSTSGAISSTAQTLAPNHGASLSTGATQPGTAAAAEGSAASSHQFLTAAPTHLDVGVFDGTHGWLRIRAELGSGGDVSASLTTSAVAHSALRAAVPEMSSYLAAESVSVSKIAVHRAADSSSAMGLTAGGSGQNGDPQARQSGQQTPGDTGVSRRNALPSDGSGSPARAAGHNDQMRGVSLPMPWVGTAFGSGGGSGSWLNVRA